LIQFDSVTLTGVRSVFSFAIKVKVRST